MGQPPKSAYELAMERLRAADPKDAKAKPLTAKQKDEIAEVRRVAKARLAEREILHQDAMARIDDPAAREQAENEYRTDRRRIDEDCDKKVEAIRNKS